MPTSTHEELARLKKSIKLADLAHAHKIAAVELEHMSEDQWNLLAWAAFVHPPSEETRTMVVADVRRREIRKNISPFPR